MKKLGVSLALVAVLVVVVAAALPAGAASANTSPVSATCGEDDVVFDVILAQGSLVAFYEGRPVVFHEVESTFTDTVSLYTGDQAFSGDFDFVAGQGQGVTDQLTVCTFEDQTVATEDLGELNARVERTLLRFYPDLIITDDDRGQAVTVTTVVSGTLWVQFPGS